jgi:GT2 family glycosyltransferase
MPAIFEERTSSIRHYPAWVGPLLDASIVDRVGLPREEVVWWGEDSEYLQVRLTQCGFPLTYCDDAVVGHSMVRRGGRPPIWRLYYETRNSIWLRVRVRQQYDSPRHMWRLLRAVASTSRSAMRHPHRGTAARAVLAGVIHGLVDPGRQAPDFVVADDGPRLAPDHSVTPAVDA